MAKILFFCLYTKTHPPCIFKGCYWENNIYISCIYISSNRKEANWLQTLRSIFSQISLSIRCPLCNHPHAKLSIRFASLWDIDVPISHVAYLEYSVNAVALSAYSTSCRNIQIETPVAANELPVSEEVSRFY